ncbi:hypothetical protein AQUCO_00700481v1 [Aquilegia coerulea]|uniref:Transmembrane protein n=1 Tax=Aquilegia coerulea TaxID=218851 RepID=A0A2G5EK70_AQUCA|nr:hypothetical protein AQUCO_00700481v1 [Aquilegia coerulea]
MSDYTQIQQQQQPPPIAVTQQAYSTQTSHGSVGALIGVLAVITILGVIAGMIGRLCSGRQIMGHGNYDFEGWIEKNCASCIDGGIDPPPPPLSSRNSSHNSIPIASPVDNLEETNPTEPHSPPQPAATTS